MMSVILKATISFMNEILEGAKEAYDDYEEDLRNKVKDFPEDD